MMRTRLWVVLGLGVLVALSGCSAPGNAEAETTIQFEDVTNSSGLAYDNIKENAYGNGNEGVYVADVNRNGWQDVLVIGGERPALFTNEGGTFEQSGELSSLKHGYRTATFVDYDGDGWRDLILFGANRSAVAFHNDKGSLERADIGLGNFTFPLGATAADFDGDGDKDLFVYQSGSWQTTKPEGYFSDTGYIEDDNGNLNVLYENTGGEFRRVRDAGLVGEHWSMAASAVDLNSDGSTDIHVANDFYYDEVYLNHGNGTFDHRYLGSRTARNGMSSEVADVTGDGAPDVFVTNIHLPLKEQLSEERFERMEMFLNFVIQSGRTKGNTLMINDGTGNFTESAAEFGVRDGGWGWAATITDFDNDGDRDLLHTTESVIRINRSAPHYTYPMLWERSADGFTNLDASKHGLEEGDGRGMVAIDYDNDGDRDVITNNHAQNITVYENVGMTGDSLQLRVADGDTGTTALGAVVRVTADGDSTLVRQMDRTDYLSQRGLFSHVGLGNAETADIHVTWPDGTERTFEDIVVNQRVRITKDGVEAVATFQHD